MRKNEIDFILEETLRNYDDISDIILTVGRPIQVISSGVFQAVSFDEVPIVCLTPFQTEVFALNILQGNSSLANQLIATGSCDCSYQLMESARFRVNVFSQRGLYSIVLRKLSSEIPSFEKLKLPSIFSTISRELYGLILVTGATGSGKSSTLASLINEINSREKAHIITLEDPIEFDHPHLQSTVNQRELGLDFDTFPGGLRAALRQTPKVILVGEMRDKETFEIVLTAAETGHLVLSTVHTNDTGQTIPRILSMFEKGEEMLIRNRLSDSLRWIIGQRLVPKIGGGRTAALEIMKNMPRISEVIMSGETEEKTFYDIIAQSATHGMCTFDQSLSRLYAKGAIEENTARIYCTRKSAMVREIDRVNAEKGIIPGMPQFKMENKENLSNNDIFYGVKMPNTEKIEEKPTLRTMSIDLPVITPTSRKIAPQERVNTQTHPDKTKRSNTLGHLDFSNLTMKSDKEDEENI